VDASSSSDEATETAGWDMRGRTTTPISKKKESGSSSAARKSKKNSEGGGGGETKSKEMENKAGLTDAWTNEKLT
jgi:hypothetical protein